MWICDKGHRNELPPCIWGIKLLTCKTCQREMLITKLGQATK